MIDRACYPARVHSPVAMLGRACRLAALLLIAVGTRLAGAGIRAAGPEKLGPGILLFASPGLGDPHFAQSVVVLIHYGSKGAMGLIINRPTRLAAAKVLPKLKQLRGTDLPLYFGGPVGTDGILTLLRTAKPPKKSTPVVAGVVLAGSLDPVRHALRGPAPERRVRIYAGYAGWGAGQLDDEVRRGGWVLAVGDADTVFTTHPEEVWPRVHGLLQRLEVFLTPPAVPDLMSGRQPVPPAP